ncbi:MAG: hypothetical protein KBD62_36870 [Kofleriaceae bacterium]|jgi:outer membrane murein-binding lipoprotein Lpp|nr:hypothetical protein [Kofleriaceae bacterium]
MMIYDYATARIAELEAELDLLRKRVDALESEKRAALVSEDQRAENMAVYGLHHDLDWRP